MGDAQIDTSQVMQTPSIDNDNNRTKTPPGTSPAPSVDQTVKTPSRPQSRTPENMAPKTPAESPAPVISSEPSAPDVPTEPTAPSLLHQRSPSVASSHSEFKIQTEDVPTAVGTEGVSDISSNTGVRKPSLKVRSLSLISASQK